MSFIQWCCEREAKSHRKRTKKPWRSIKELEIFVSQIFYNFFSICFFFSITLLYHFFLYLFYPRHLATLMSCTCNSRFPKQNTNQSRSRLSLPCEQSPSTLLDKSRRGRNPCRHPWQFILSMLQIQIFLRLQSNRYRSIHRVLISANVNVGWNVPVPFHPSVSVFPLDVEAL